MFFLGLQSGQEQHKYNPLLLSKSSSLFLLFTVLIILSSSERNNYLWIIKREQKYISCLSNVKYTAFCCCAAVVVCLTGKEKGTSVLWVLLCPRTCPYHLVVDQYWRWLMRFSYQLAQLDSEATHTI